MEANQKQTDESKMTFIAKCGLSLFVIGVTIILILGGIRAFRDNSPSGLSQRFVRNNEIIKEKAGGIFKADSFRNGINSGNSWEMTGNVYGNNRNILQVTVYLGCDIYISEKCHITRAKYRSKSDALKNWNDSDWHEIEVDWWEKFMLTFK
jgi:hypothetical protein